MRCMEARHLRQRHSCEYTNKIFLAEVRKHRHNPYASLYTGFEMEWANYKAIVMGMKFLQLLPTVLLTSKTVSEALNGDDINKQEGNLAEVLGAGLAALVMLLFAGLAFKASPYVDPINDKMDHVSRVVLFITLIAVASKFRPSMDFVWAIVLNLVPSPWILNHDDHYVMACCKQR